MNDRETVWQRFKPTGEWRKVGTYRRRRAQRIVGVRLRIAGVLSMAGYDCKALPEWVAPELPQPQPETS